jgi:RecA/RadA recombinase
MLQVAGAGLCSGAVVEVRGASGVGKSEILLNVAVQHALRKDLGGEGRIAVYFDLGKNRALEAQPAAAAAAAEL